VKTAAQSTPQPHRITIAGPAIASAIVSLILYAVTLGGTYVYDDIQIVKDDPRVHHPSQWVHLWTTDYFNGGLDNLYRPLVSSSYAIQWWLHGDRPWMFHLVNILLHAGVCAAVAELTRRAVKISNPHQAISAAYIAGLLFAVVPLHTEAVANIVGRAELACSLGILVALLIFAHRPLTTARVLAIVLCSVFALLCKEQGLLQPLLLALFGWLVWNKFREVVEPDERAAIRLLALLICWIWAGYIVGREHFLKFEWDRANLDPTFQPLLRSVGIDRVLMPIVLLGRYTALLVWPAHLSIDYGADVIGWHARFTDPYLWMGMAAVLLWAVAVGIAWILRAGFVLFCLLALAITYGLIGNIVTLIMTNFAERLMYLPSAFLLMALAVATVKLPTKPRIVLLGIVLSVAGVRTFFAARDWNRPMELFQKELAEQPKSIQLHLLLAQQYQNQHDCKSAIAVLQDACDQYPGYWRIWMFRAFAEMDAGEFAMARKHLERAKELNGNPILLSAYARLDNAQKKQ
jgi:hypothetical protein